MRGWERTLSALMRAHGRELYAYAFALTGHAGSADVILEDALVSVLQGARVRSLEGARGSVLRSMRHALAHNKHRAPPGAGAGPALDEIAQAPELDVAVAASAMHRNVAAARAYVEAHPMREDPDPVDGLMHGFSALPAAERVCVVMRYLDGLDAESIGAEVGLDADVVRARLVHAVETLEDWGFGQSLDAEDAAWGGSEFVDVTGRRP
ncbi:hypothetical protein [Demequina sp.]|uniref:RNA polymerase sigma factor n=1 Tax=Demequina sp. TaxID=2050685 RepID=UPI0025DA72FD|nr:hypothetical protein [Demequina sp.]